MPWTALPQAPLELPAFDSSPETIGGGSRRAYGTIYSGIRLNHAECPFEKVLNPSSIGPEPAVSILLKRTTGGGGHAPLGCPVSCAGHANHADGARAKERFDVGVGGFYQVTNASNGNFIRDDTTESGGGLFSFRQPYRPWLGYEVNVGYTKFYEAYNKGVVKVESNVTDLSFSYLFQSPTYLRGAGHT